MGAAASDIGAVGSAAPDRLCSPHPLCAHAMWRSWLPFPSMSSALRLAGCGLHIITLWAHTCHLQFWASDTLPSFHTHSLLTLSMYPQDILHAANP